MKKFIRLQALLIAVTIIAFIAMIAHAVFGTGFWLAFVLLAAGMFINGLIAEREDNQPGGLNRPLVRKKDDLLD